MRWACFVALKPSIDACEYLADTRRDLEASGFEAAWFDTTYLHLTLAYIGWMGDVEFSRVSNAIREGTSESKSADIRFSGRVMKLGHDMSNHYLCLEVAADRSLLQLHQQVLDVLSKLLCRKLQWITAR